MTDNTPQPPPQPARRSRRWYWSRSPLSDEERSDRQLRKWADLIETLILTLATFATAWAGFQANQWNNAQGALSFAATRALIEALDYGSQAQQAELLDVTLFAEWVDAYATGSTRLMALHRGRFRDEFAPAFDAWLATDPLANPDAPGSPFEMAEYRVTARDQAEAAQRQSVEVSQLAEIVGGYGDRYTLITVILAGALLLAGLSHRFEWAEMRAAIAGTAGLVLVVSVVVMVMLPVA